MDANHTEVQLRFGMDVYVSKSNEWNHYPLEKLQLFNYSPYELNIYTKNGDCLEDLQQKQVTCGWYYFISLILDFLF